MAFLSLSFIICHFIFSFGIRVLVSVLALYGKLFMLKHRCLDTRGASQRSAGKPACPPDYRVSITGAEADKFVQSHFDVG